MQFYALRTRGSWSWFASAPLSLDVVTCSVQSARSSLLRWMSRIFLQSSTAATRLQAGLAP